MPLSDDSDVFDTPTSDIFSLASVLPMRGGGRKYEAEINGSHVPVGAVTAFILVAAATVPSASQAISHLDVPVATGVSADIVTPNSFAAVGAEQPMTGIEATRMFRSILDRESVLAERARVLFEWCDFDPVRASEYIVRSLGDDRSDDMWRAQLIDAAETMDIHNRRSQKRLRSALNDQIGRMVRKSTFDDDPALWSAIRRYSSLTSVRQTAGLAKLFRIGGPAAKQVALQSIQYLFMATPPLKRIVGLELCDLAERMASRLLRRETSARSSKQNALLLNSIAAVAALGDERLPTLIEELRKSRDAVTARLLRNRLQEIQRSWTQSARMFAALERLESAIAMLAILPHPG